ncbi:MAG: histidine--tRNA ligase [Tissierellia bacterium]|nr:histidine--tRNA ligase [Tissierellia bacterium]
MAQIVKPSTLPGFMELLPQDQRVLDQMKAIIEKNYRDKGFLAIDTPVLEREEVLLAKGGGDTEKQIYRFTKGKTDLAMRFDLTVPLARYVAEHYSHLSFPFRRYHIGKVYRGERQQKGRFREFYQCDIDIIGNGSLDLFHDGEIPSIIEGTFMDLGFDAFTIHINNRKILNGFYQAIGIEEPQNVLRIVDKQDKVAWEVLEGELAELGLSKEQIQSITEFKNISGTNGEIFEALEALSLDHEAFQTGLEELKTVVAVAEMLLKDEGHIQVDLSIARGLDYYTGTVYETFLDDYPKIGSVCSGGRYENLAEHYTKQSLPGVGVSIGLSRLYYQLNEGGLLKDYSSAPADVLIVAFDAVRQEGLKLLKAYRDHGVRAIFYADKGKVGKKFKYADDLGLPYVAVLGEDEVKEGSVTLRNMTTGQEERLSVEESISRLLG